jgi:uncharacterized protein
MYELSNVTSMHGITARWQDWAGIGWEHLELREGTDGVVAEAVVLGTEDGVPFGAGYRIVCDPFWRVRSVDVQRAGGAVRLSLVSDGAGNWRYGSGEPLPELVGALDVDLTATPFTNTLPIRRLRLKAGESAEIRAAYIRFPDLAVMPDRQRYTCLEAGRLYRYEAVDGDFSRDIEVDDNGLVVTYPGLFRRIL